MYWYILRGVPEKVPCYRFCDLSDRYVSQFCIQHFWRVQFHFFFLFFGHALIKCNEDAEDKEIFGSFFKIILVLCSASLAYETK